MFTTWSLVGGLLLIAIGLSDTWRQQLPVSSSALYLLAGALVGPQAFGLIRLELQADAVLLEHLAEVAVLISLFAVGLRLRVRLADRIWLTPALLASVAMLITIGLMLGLGLALGLPPGAALLLAAVLAPTDPVLASEVQVRHARDLDRLRFSLTGEGGLNDGSAAPFVMLALGLLGLHELGPWALRWWALDLLASTLVGLALGWGLGFGFGRAVVWLRREREQALGMESFYSLGLIALAYGASQSVRANGFLAVFAAGLAMRQVEWRQNPGRPPGVGSKAEAEVDPEQAPAYMAKAVLDFTQDLEKLAELGVMLVIGGLLSRRMFSAASLGVALFLIFVARPVAVYLTTWPLALTPQQRRLAAWFGIRGVGSMYYLAYAIAHGAATPGSAFVADAVLTTIVLSVLLHGSSATPVMRLYRKARARGE